MLILKPNIGAPVLALAAIWLLGSRRWKALAGMLAAGQALLLAGLLQDPRWVSEYLGIGSHKMNMTLGFNPRGWGIAGAVCGHADLCTLRLGFSAAVLTGLPLMVLLWRAGSRLRPAVAMGTIVASALLLTPYLWAYDHLLLVVPLVAVMGLLAERRSPYLLAATTPILFAVLALALAALAGSQGHDGWSGLLPLVAFGAMVGLAGPWNPAHSWFNRRISLSRRASS